MSIDIIEFYFEDLTDEQKQQLERLVELYHEWNEKINVISRKDMDALVEKHILHAMSIAKYQKFKAGWYVLDLGTGGGLPGLPLAILFPEIHFILVDSIAKKIKVVDAIVEDLGLKNVKTKWARAEMLDVKVNLVVTRAVAPLSQIIQWSKKLLKTQSKGIIALKGGDLTEELAGLKKKTTVTPVSQFFDTPFFETKAIVHYKP